MPKLSDTMTEGTLVRWIKKVGDTIAVRLTPERFQPFDRIRSRVYSSPLGQIADDAVKREGGRRITHGHKNRS